jgi:hypothetical protein
MSYLAFLWLFTGGTSGKVIENSRWMTAKRESRANEQQPHPLPSAGQQRPKELLKGYFTWCLCSDGIHVYIPVLTLLGLISVLNICQQHHDTKIGE